MGETTGHDWMNNYAEKDIMVKIDLDKLSEEAELLRQKKFDPQKMLHLGCNCKDKIRITKNQMSYSLKII